MPELKCSVHTCAHNKQNYCDLDSIEVKGASASHMDETSCASFVEKKGCTTCNSAKEAKPVTNVSCKATQCTYNEGCKCQAGKIQVDGSKACRCDETVCATFEAR